MKVEVGDIVKATRNAFAKDVRYVVRKTNKTTCWVQVKEGHGTMVMRGGKRVECLPLYKNTPYSAIAKV